MLALLQPETVLTELAEGELRAELEGVREAEAQPEADIIAVTLNHADEERVGGSEPLGEALPPPPAADVALPNPLLLPVPVALALSQEDADAEPETLRTEGDGTLVPEPQAPPLLPDGALLCVPPPPPSPSPEADGEPLEDSVRAAGVEEAKVLLLNVPGKPVTVPPAMGPLGLLLGLSLPRADVEEEAKALAVRDARADADATDSLDEAVGMGVKLPEAQLLLLSEMHAVALPMPMLPLGVALKEEQSLLLSVVIAVALPDGEGVGNEESVGEREIAAVPLCPAVTLDVPLPQPVGLAQPLPALLRLPVALARALNVAPEEPVPSATEPLGVELTVAVSAGRALALIDAVAEPQSEDTAEPVGEKVVPPVTDPVAQPLVLAPPRRLGVPLPLPLAEPVAGGEDEASGEPLKEALPLAVEVNSALAERAEDRVPLLLSAGDPVPLPVTEALREEEAHAERL